MRRLTTPEGGAAISEIAAHLNTLESGILGSCPPGIFSRRDSRVVQPEGRRGLLSRNRQPVRAGRAPGRCRAGEAPSVAAWTHRPLALLPPNKAALRGGGNHG